MTTESDLIQNDTSSDAKQEALKVSDNAECEVQEDTDAIPKQSDTTIIPEDIQREEAHSEFTVIHKRKIGSTRRPLRGKHGQRKEKEHHDENETPDSEGMINVEKETISLEDEPSLDESTLQSLKDGAKEQEMEICEKNDVGPVEGSESADLQSSCSSDLTFEESILISICHITESQTLMKLNEEYQENAGDAEKVAAEEDKDLQLKIESQNKIFDSTTSEAEGTEENINDVSVTLVREVEVIGDTGTVESNMTTESDFLQISPDAHIEALKISENAEEKVSGETDTILIQSDISIIPTVSHREEVHSKSSPVIHKRKMGSTRRPLEGNKGQRQEHDEKKIFSLDDESRYTAVSVCDISESQTLPNTHAGSQENTGDVEIVPAEGETERHLENKTFDPTAFEGEATEENICEASVLVKEVEFIGDTVTVESNMTTESDFIQNDISSDAKQEALKVSDNTECEVQEDTDAIPKQSDTTIIPEDIQREEAHSEFTVIHKRKIGSTRRPLRGKHGQRKEKEHHDENETPDSEGMINVEKETISLEDEPSLDEPRYTAVSDISESQTLTKFHAESQEDYKDVERALVGRDTEPHSVQTEITTLNSATFEGEGTEEIICEASVVVKEIEFIGDTVTVESDMTIKSDFLQNDISTDTKSEALISEIAENEGKKDTIPKQSDANIIPEVPHGEEVHTKLSLNVQKRKMGSTRRPLKGNKGQRKEHDEKEIFILEDESRYTAASVCDISESQTLPKTHAGSQEDTGNVEIVPAEGDTERHLENKTFDSTAFEEEAAEENICEASVLIKEVEFIGDTVTVESNMTKSDLLQNYISTDAKPEALISEIAENEGKTDTIPKQSDANIIPEVPHGEEVHTKLSLNVQKRKMGSTRRPLKGNKGQRQEHNEKEIFSLEDEPSPDESRYIAVSICDISESQTLPKTHAGSQENTGDVEIVPAEGDTERHLENKTFDSTAFEEATEENICEASVLIKEVEFIGDTVTVESNMTTESDLIQNDTSSDAKQEALKVSDNAECEVQEDTDAIPKQSDTTIIPEDIQTEEAHSESTVIHKRKMGSTRRPLRGKHGQRKEKEHHDENETPDSEGMINVEKETICLEDEPSLDESTLQSLKDGAKEQEMEICEKNDFVPVEGSESADLQSSCSSDLTSEESIAISICHITESQTLMKLNEESQENAGDAERVAVGGETDLHLEIKAQIKTSDSTSEAEGTEKNIHDASVLVREVEIIGDTVTVESNMTSESDFLQSSPDALKVSQNSAKEVSGETETILKQSDINIIPEDSHGEEAHSKSSPVIHKRKMASTRRPLKGNKGQRKEIEHHDENETLECEGMINVEKETISLEDEPSLDEPRYTAVSDISESQTLTKLHAESQEDYNEVERALVGRDTEPHSVQTEITTLNSGTFEGEGTEEIICEASVVVKEIEFIGDTVTVESNMTVKSDLLQNDISTDAKPEALISEIAENEGKTDTIPKQSGTKIIPEVPHGEEVHTKLSLNVQKRKMGSTRRPLRGNKGQRKVRVESEEKNGDIEVLSEVEDTETRLEIQNQDNVVDHNVTQEIMNIRDNEDEEKKTTKTVDMSVQELCDDLELEQRPDVSQTQTGPSQDDTGSYLLQVPERTADFVRDRFACKSHSDLVLSDALLIEETQIHESSEDVPPTEMVEMHPVSKRSMQKRKMGSTRKRGKRMVNDEEVEEKEGETENTTNDDGTTKSEENLTIEEAIAGSPVHQQLFSSSADKEGHDIQDIGSKSDVQTEISEPNDPNSTINPELLIESECSSNVAAEMVSDLPLGDADTYLGPKQSVIPKESLREDQSSLNPVVQKRKMGSTRKTLRGNKGQGKEVESKKMDRDSEEMTQEQDTEPHLATSARKTECKFDEEAEQNFPVEFSYPVASSKMFSESENGVKEVSPNIHDLSEVSEEKGMESTGNYSNSENKAINLYDGTKDKFVLTVSHEDVDQTVTVDYLDQHVYVGSEPEQTENTGHSFPTQELKNTQDDVVYEISSTQEKRRKMGSTRRYPRVMHGENMANNEDGLGVAEDRETKKAEDDLDDMPLASSISQSKEVSSVRTTDLESEMLSSATDLKGEHDHQNNSEPSGPTVPETPENTLQICDNQLVNADVTKHPQSETVTTEKRRKMGSTRKNLREGRIQGKRDGYEETETTDTNLQMSQDSEMSLGEQTTHDYSNQSEDSLLCELERALNKTSQHSMSNDRESIVKEPNPEDLVNASDLNMSENSEIKSLQPTPLAHSEPNSPGRRRRKMGSTRKNPREQLKAEREDEDKEDGEKDENLKTDKQENKDLERVEVSIVHNITENKLNKEYLDVSSAHTSSSQLEESTNPVSQERTSPSTKRKFGSRRTKGKQGLGSLAASDFGNELEDGDHKPDSSEVEDKLCSDDLEVCDPCLTLQPENQPIAHPVSEQRNMEAKNEEAAPKGTGAGLVSLDQIMKHDRSTGAKQTVNLKNRISDAEVVQFNIVMVGNSCVGKTSFIRRFHEGQFTEDYRSTIGVDTCTQTVALPDRTVKLQIWDTAGQERFHSITTQVFHKADGLLLMYEITCSNSFISVRDWISQAQKRAPDDVIMMLLGNKNDSVKRAVQIQEGAELAREYNINFMECSAATGANVSESMRTLAELLMQRKSQKERHTTLRREPSQKKSGCC
ncbi:uncharacterized protein LOC107667361 isoform X2 [Sinocyclocheilus anshuiensis]|uniref:uncharacterized protein LOC107667361 isoform X2 n=1 Tax=Sinocyclocheilus anshuiensis TaxID=1608454 RepID=UPI0007BAD39D|nr:PREDICTED: uncharacterized protein LOC107667361 isoform X2 [Sinocyclocheilus anshuiensis]